MALRFLIYRVVFSAGDTIEEALANAQEAAECHIEGILIDSETHPGAYKY